MRQTSAAEGWKLQERNENDWQKSTDFHCHGATPHGPLKVKQQVPPALSHDYEAIMERHFRPQVATVVYRCEGVLAQKLSHSILIYLIISYPCLYSQPAQKFSKLACRCVAAAVSVILLLSQHLICDKHVREEYSV